MSRSRIMHLYVKLLCLISYCICNARAQESIRVYKTFAQQDVNYITSLKWPLKYPVNSDIIYKIVRNPRVKSEFYLELKWLEFDIKGDMDECDDFVRVRYNNQSNQPLILCSARKPHDIYSFDNEVELYFHSNQSVVGYGFKLAYRLVPFERTFGPTYCRHMISLVEPWGILSSPTWPIPRNQSTCVYEIMLQPDEILALNIMDFDMRSDSNPYCNRYSNFIAIKGTESNKSFTESCPIKFLSSCDKLNKWILHVKKRRIFIHVNLMENHGNRRGFLAGYNVYKVKSSEDIGFHQKQRRFDWVSDAVLIGAVTGILIGLIIVLMTIFSVSFCMKRGII